MCTYFKQIGYISISRGWIVRNLNVRQFTERGGVSWCDVGYLFDVMNAIPPFQLVFLLLLGIPT